MRHTIVDELTAGRRVRLHARIAQALERAAATRDVAAGDLAAQFAAAGNLVDADRALRYTREAGDEAAARLAFDVAAEQYERAVEAHRRLPSAPAGQRLDLELARGRALSLAGDARAAAVLRGVAAAAEAAGDGRRMAEALLALGLDFADFVEEDTEMVGLLRSALALLPPGDSAIRARLEGFFAQEAFSSVPDSERRAMVGRALAMARRARDPAALASVLTSHSWIVAGPERVRERLALADELVAIGREGASPTPSPTGISGASWRLSSSGTWRRPTRRSRQRIRPRGPRGRTGPSGSSARRGRCSPVGSKTQRPKPCGPRGPARRGAPPPRSPRSSGCWGASAWSRAA